MNKRLHQRPTNRVFRRARLVIEPIITSFLSVLLCVPCASFGQNSPSNLNALRVEPSNSNERTTFWLLNEDGSWRVPLPNWTVDEVAQIVESREENANAAPYSIRSVDAFGAIKDDLARLTIQIEINVNDDVVRVPLGLQEGVYIPTPEEEASGKALTGGFSYEGPGYCSLDVDPKTGGYVATIQTPRSSRRRPGARRNLNAVPSTNSEASQSDATNLTETNSATPRLDVANSTGDPEEANSATPQSDVAPQSDVTNPTVVPTETNSETVSSPETESNPNVPDASSDANQDGADSSESAPQSEEKEPTSDASSTPAAAVLASTNERYAAQVVAEEEPSAPLNATRSASYRLTLELCFTVESFGDEYRFAATFPPSAGSQMRLEVPLSDLQLGSVSGAVALAPSPFSESSTEIKLRGLGRSGEKTVASWRKSSVKTVETQVVYQVENASIRVELSPRETFYDVALPIRVFGGETDVFYVVLPPDAMLIPDEIYAVDENGASLDLLGVRTLNGDDPSIGSELRFDAEEIDASAKIVEARLVKSIAFASLRLKARVSLREPTDSSKESNSNAFRSTRSISGFSLLGAAKQYGTIRTTNTQELDFSVVASYGAAPSNEETATEGEESFRLFSQPFELQAQAYERKGVVNVKPEYQILIGTRTAKLRARFQYAVYGEKIKEVRVDLRDWILTTVETTDLVNLDNLTIDKTTGETILSLKTPSDGEIVVDLTASRGLDGTDESEISLEIPNPVGDWVESAIVVVASDDNVQNVPIPESCVGLTSKLARSITPTLETPQTTQKPYYYLARQRFVKVDEEDAESKYVAKIKRLKQEIDVKVDVETTISTKGETKVRQTFIYDVKYEPLDSLSIRTPSRLLELSGSRRALNLKYFLDGKPVPPQNLQSSTDDDNSVTRRVIFDSPKIGACELTVQYEYAPLDVRSGSTSRIDLDLMQPEEGKLLSNDLTIVSPVGVELTYQEIEGRAWKLSETTQENDGTTKQTRFNSVKFETGARFTATLKLKEGLNSTIVERAWIQSWLADGKRVDRAAYRIFCDLDFVEICLPLQADLDRIVFAVDGKTIGINANAQDSLIDKKNRVLRVPVPKGKESKEFTLELSYVASNALGSYGRRNVQFPTFVDPSVWIQRVYWQVLTPFNLHIVSNPQNWTPEFFLKQSGIGIYNRIESISQDELCEWIGVESRRPIPDEVNSYLFSCFDEKESARFYLVDRAVLILIGSGTTLILGLGLIYFPIVRSRIALLLIGTVLLALGAFRPTLAAIFLQTTAFGVGLVLFVLVLTSLASFRENIKKKGAVPSTTARDVKD